MEGISALVCFLPLAVLTLVCTVFWFWMFIECLAKEPSGSEKIIWAIVMLALNGLGALLYFFIRRPQRIREQRD